MARQTAKYGRRLATYSSVLVIYVFLTHFLCGAEGLNRSCVTTCKIYPWMTPYPTCTDGACKCEDDLCVHYSVDDGGNYRYFCGSCGDLGSECTETPNCKFPGECYRGFCECNSGYLEEDLCLHYQPVTTSIPTIVLISVFIGLLIANKIISSYRGIYRFLQCVFCCSRCRPSCCCRPDSVNEQDTVYGYNYEGDHKSPAFTISSTEFITSTDDPDLEWALELSIQLSSNGYESQFQTNPRLQRTNAIRRTRREPPLYEPIRTNVRSSTRRGPSEASGSSTGSIKSSSSSQISFESVTKVFGDEDRTSTHSCSDTGSTNNPSCSRRSPGAFPRQLRSNSDYLFCNSGEEVVLTNIIRRPRRLSSASTEACSSNMSSFRTEDSFSRPKRVTLREFLAESEVPVHKHLTKSAEVRGSTGSAQIRERVSETTAKLSGTLINNEKLNESLENSLEMNTFSSSSPYTNPFQDTVRNNGQ